ncbi:MAG TPA: phosphodiesterase, partial [Gammaproteobacteria bacterium]
MHKLVQLTDCHLLADCAADYKGVNPSRSLKQVCEHIAEHHPDTGLLVLTGDLSQDESVESYTRLCSLVSQFKVPVYALPGNHDNLQNMRVAFGDKIEINQSIVLEPWKIHLLNSTVPGETAGMLGASELDRLQQQLRLHSDAPSLIALHHHPVIIGSDWMDRLGLRNADALLSILHCHQQVKAVLFGHIHQAFHHRQGSITYLGTPSTCVQFKPN